MRAIPFEIGGRGVFANPEVEVAPGAAVVLEVAGPGEGEIGLGGRRQVGRSAEQPGDRLGQIVEDRLPRSRGSRSPWRRAG